MSGAAATSMRVLILSLSVYCLLISGERRRSQCPPRGPGAAASGHRPLPTQPRAARLRASRRGPLVRLYSLWLCLLVQPAEHTFVRPHVAPCPCYVQPLIWRPECVHVCSLIGAHGFSLWCIQLHPLLHTATGAASPSAAERCYASAVPARAARCPTWTNEPERSTPPPRHR